MTGKALTDAQRSDWHTRGYHIARALLAADEAADLAEHYMTVPQRPTIAGHDAQARAAAGQPLDPRGHNAVNYPRLMHPHRYDPRTREILLDPRLFNGSLIHSSLRNRTENRWRRSLVLHYCPTSQTDQIAPFYQPLITRSGCEIRVTDAPADAGACGGREGNNPE